MRILIAEDEPTSRLVLERSLAKLGHEYVSCEDGAEAWDALQQPDAPAMAILDWMMPRMDGVDVCRKVRASDELRHLYIIMLTTRDTEEDIVEGLKAGARPE